MTRRSVLELAAFGAASAAAATDPPYSLPKLPYAFDALEPYIDAQTIQIHHDKHHQAYVDNLNKAIGSDPALAKLGVEELLQRLDSMPAAIRTQVRNQGGGHANHSLFWQTLATAAKSGKPTGPLAAALDRKRSHGWIAQHPFDRDRARARADVPQQFAAARRQGG